MPKECIHCHEVKKSSEFYGRETGCKECKKTAQKKRRDAFKDAIVALEQRFDQSVAEKESLQDRIESLEKQVRNLKINADHTVCAEEISKLQEEVALTQDVYTRTVEAMIGYLDGQSGKSPKSAESDTSSTLDQTLVLKSPAIKSKSALYEKYSYKPNKP